jgi:hypothetical protein
LGQNIPTMPTYLEPPLTLIHQPTDLSRGTHEWRAQLQTNTTNPFGHQSAHPRKARNLRNVGRGRGLVSRTSHTSLQMLPGMGLGNQCRMRGRHLGMVSHYHRRALSFLHRHYHRRNPRPNPRTPVPDPIIINLPLADSHRQQLLQLADIFQQHTQRPDHVPREPPADSPSLVPAPSTVPIITPSPQWDSRSPTDAPTTAPAPIPTVAPPTALTLTVAPTSTITSVAPTSPRTAPLSNYVGGSHSSKGDSNGHPLATPSPAPTVAPPPAPSSRVAAQ